MEPKTKINAEEGRQDLTITRTFDLPLELLFKAYQEAELLARWMGTRVVKLENKNHGSYRFETTHNGAVVFRAHGTIHAFIPNQQIIRTFEMENADLGVQLEFLSFEKLTEDTSKLTMQVIYQSAAHRARQLKMPFAYGLNMAHNKLEEILSSQK